MFVFTDAPATTQRVSLVLFRKQFMPRIGTTTALLQEDLVLGRKNVAKRGSRMNARILSLLVMALVCSTTAKDTVKWHPGHYFKVGRTQDLLLFLDEKAPFDRILACTDGDLIGLQADINWRDIEKSRGSYDFSYIDSALAVVDRHGKKLILRIYDRAFWNDCQGLDNPVPDWIPTSNLKHANGCAARLWENWVADEYIKMMRRVAERYDGDSRLAAIFTPESALDVDGLSSADQTNKLANYSRMVRAVGDAFTQTIVAPHLNWPQDYVDQIVAEIEDSLAAKGVGLSTPDAVPAKDGLRIIGHMKRLSGQMALLPNMDGSFMGDDTPQQLYAMHTDIGSNYLVWARWRSFDGSGIIDKVLSFLTSGERTLNTDCPTSLNCGGVTATADRHGFERAANGLRTKPSGLVNSAAGACYDIAGRLLRTDTRMSGVILVSGTLRVR